MVVVDRFRDLPGAEVASATLAAAGITNSLRDTYTIGLIWTYSSALGWIRLSVSDADLEEARLLLAPGEFIEWPAFESEEGADERCRVCDSNELAIQSAARRTLALMLLFPIPLWIWRSRLICRTCGAAWKVPLRFRPEMILAWSIAALVAIVATAVVTFSAMYVMRGRT